jgi:hypothetical protein
MKNSSVRTECGVGMKNCSVYRIRSTIQEQNGSTFGICEYKSRIAVYLHKKYRVQEQSSSTFKEHRAQKQNSSVLKDYGVQGQNSSLYTSRT